MANSSKVRSLAKSASYRIFRDPLKRKQTIVHYYNLRAAMTRILKNGESYDPFHPTSRNLANTFHIDEAYRGNALYGIGKYLRDYSGYNSQIPACIEHGLVLGDGFDEDMFDGAIPNVITMSDLRASRFCERGLNGIAVGPYISYAPSYYSDDALEEIKNALGRVLLVFPGHSIEENSDSNSNTQLLIQEISHEIKRNDINTVIISIYYNDFLHKRTKLFESLGYKVYCSGHRYDPRFLSRLKSAILLADCCITDSIGTHLGYSVSLGKPGNVQFLAHFDSGIASR